MTDLTYSRVAAHQANQLHSSRGGGQWSTSIIAADLREALTDANLLNALAKDIRRGDRVLIASYLSEKDFADEQRDAVAQLLIVDVEKPDKATARLGKVAFKVLDLFSLGPRPEKVIQDRGSVEAVSS